MAVRSKKKKRMKRAARGAKISKSIAWIEKYLERVRKKMPALVMPRVVRSFKPQLKKKHRTLGNCCKQDKTITLATHWVKEKTVNGRKKQRRVPYSRHEILQTFAHELSHLAYDDHGYEQEWYGLTIFNTFGLKEPCPHCGGKGNIPARYEND